MLLGYQYGLGCSTGEAAVRCQPDHDGPPTIAQHMKAANDELGVEDLAVLGRKEKARESRAE